MLLKFCQIIPDIVSDWLKSDISHHNVCQHCQNCQHCVFKMVVKIIVMMVVMIVVKIVVKICVKIVVLLHCNGSRQILIFFSFWYLVLLIPNGLLFLSKRNEIPIPIYCMLLDPQYDKCSLPVLLKKALGLLLILVPVPLPLALRYHESVVKRTYFDARATTSQRLCI